MSALTNKFNDEKEEQKETASREDRTPDLSLSNKDALFVVFFDYETNALPKKVQHGEGDERLGMATEAVDLFSANLPYLLSYRSTFHVPSSKEVKYIIFVLCCVCVGTTDG